MRKILLFLLAFVIGITAKAQVVQSQIKVEQYKVVVDVNVECFNTDIYRYNPNPAFSPTITSQYGGYCGAPCFLIPGTGVLNCCHDIVILPLYAYPWLGSIYNNDAVSVSYYNSASNAVPFKTFSRNGFNSPNSSYQYSDTTYLYNSEFDIPKIKATLANVVVDTSQPTIYNGNNLEFNYPTRLTSNEYYPTGTFYEETKTIFGYSIAQPGYQGPMKYKVSTRVRVIINADPVLTLASHDSIKIVQTNPTIASYEGGGTYPYHPSWQYTLFPFTTWLPVPVQATGSRGEQLQLSGYDLLGADYLNHLNETVFIRDAAVNTYNVTPSDTVAFILRLSSPHIKSITPAHLKCFEVNDGSLKIKFDRQLLVGERLNIFLFDTLNRINFSTFNIDNLAADSSYTWANELPRGVYLVSLIGKYARGVTYDLHENNRVDTIRIYKALNSINFEDGFNTTAVADTFDAFTNFEGYSIATFTGSINHFGYKELTQPDKIRVSALIVNKQVQCKGSATGEATVVVYGGFTTNYSNGSIRHYKYRIKNQDSTQFSSFINFTDSVITTSGGGYGVSQKMLNLRAGTYQLHIRDLQDCYARDSVGNEVVYSFTITEPPTALTINSIVVYPLTSVDSINGGFKIKYSGGTQFPLSGAGSISTNEAYFVSIWRPNLGNSSNAYLQNNIHFSDTTSIDSVYTVQTINNLPDGPYVVRVYDKNYAPWNGNVIGCYQELQINLVKPDTLKVKLVSERNISCNGSKDGELRAKASGGIRNDSTGYTFEWYRIPSPGQSTPLPGGDTSIHLYGDSLITGLGIGMYRVQITDKYNNKKSDTFVLAQPTLMQLNFTSTQASCYSSFDGSMSVQVTGGTPFSDTAHKYRYEWSNGGLTQFVNNVAGGRYLLVVRDSMGCIAHDTVEVQSPVRVIATDSTHKVSCYNSADGSISLSMSGGASTFPYTYLWSTGATTPSITGLVPGTYWYKASDHNGCYDTDTIVLTKPDTLLVNLGPDRKMCLGQILRLDGTPANASATTPLTYNWQSNYGFSANTAKVNITDSGRYILSVTEPVRGCTLRDTIKISRIDSLINTDFIVSTQAFKNENVILVNLSKPYPQDSILWVIPQLGNTVQLISQSTLNAQVLFADTGRYPVTMRVFYRSGCIDDTTKYVNVTTNNNFGNIGNQANAYLKLYALIVPNPNPGTFDVQLTFSEATTAKLRLINTLTNLVVDTRQVTIPNTNMYTVPYSLGTGVLNGMYVLLIETPKGSFVAKVVILH
jgi:hypothetical protein